jgi:divalent metal cation (Fe/Co/Zn/Cd) transporter
MPAEERRRARAIVEGSPGVREVVHLRTMHLGPRQAIAAIKVKLDDALTTRDIERAIDEIERRLRAELPVLERIYIEPGFEDASQRARAAKVGASAIPAPTSPEGES